ncbi:MAG: hypothetical protein MRY83_22375 [Flavobacteriales bacterium]|nr:hypothetical protein [Flavobacteriales bacterium]
MRHIKAKIFLACVILQFPVFGQNSEYFYDRSDVSDNLTKENMNKMYITNAEFKPLVQIALANDEIHAVTTLKQPLRMFYDQWRKEESTSKHRWEWKDALEENPNHYFCLSYRMVFDDSLAACWRTKVYKDDFLNTKTFDHIIWDAPSRMRYRPTDAYRSDAYFPLFGFLKAVAHRLEEGAHDVSISVTVGAKYCRSVYDVKDTKLGTAEFKLYLFQEVLDQLQEL